MSIELFVYVDCKKTYEVIADSNSTRGSIGSPSSPRFSLISNTANTLHTAYAKIESANDFPTQTLGVEAKVNYQFDTVSAGD